MLEVSKIINNIGSTATPFTIPNQANYTNAEVTKLVIDSNKSLKNHLMKTIYINKIAPTYKEYVLAKEPATFHEANNLAVALWRRKYPEGLSLKPKSILAIETRFGLKNNSELSQEEREVCTNAIREKRNNGQNLRQNGGFSS